MRPSTSPYVSTIVMVKKKGGSNRCVLTSESCSTAGMKYLSKINLTKGYWQIPVATQDVYKTAFVTPDRQNEFLRMPFGMVNSGATLVQGMKKVLEGLPGVSSYIDDIVTYRDSWKEHLSTLKELFSRLRRARITARPKKMLARSK